MDDQQPTFRPDRQRENFGDQSPAHRANSIREVGDICNKSVLDDTNETVCAQRKLTEPNKNNSNPTSYGMLVPIVRTGSDNGTNDELADEHALNEVSTSNVVDLDALLFTYLHCLQEPEVYDRPCQATLLQGL